MQLSITNKVTCYDYDNFPFQVDHECLTYFQKTMKVSKYQKPRFQKAPSAKSAEGTKSTKSIKSAKSAENPRGSKPLINANDIYDTMGAADAHSEHK